MKNFIRLAGSKGRDGPHPEGATAGPDDEPSKGVPSGDFNVWSHLVRPSRPPPPGAYQVWLNDRRVFDPPPTEALSLSVSVPTELFFTLTV